MLFNCLSIAPVASVASVVSVASVAPVFFLLRIRPDVIRPPLSVCQAILSPSLAAVSFRPPLSVVRRFYRRLWLQCPSGLLCPLSGDFIAVFGCSVRCFVHLQGARRVSLPPSFRSLPRLSAGPLPPCPLLRPLPGARRFPRRFVPAFSSRAAHFSALFRFLSAPGRFQPAAQPPAECQSRHQKNRPYEPQPLPVCSQLLAHSLLSGCSCLIRRLPCVIRNFAPPKFRKVNQPEIGKVK